LHDGIELEKRKIPTAVICSDLFINTAQAQAVISGIPSYPFVTLPHPIARMGIKDLRNKAKLAAGQVIKILINK
jgi:hypothetical protein